MTNVKSGMREDIDCFLPKEGRLVEKQCHHGYDRAIYYKSLLGFPR